MNRPVTVEHLSDSDFRVTINLPDVVGLLSLTAGLFTSCGLNIREAEIGTGEESARDVFEVSGSFAPDWGQIEKELVGLAADLKTGKASEVRAKINDRINEYLRAHKEKYAKELFPIDLTVTENPAAREAVVDVKSEDTPAFLYELSTALALLGFNIRRMEVRTKGTRVEDRIWIGLEGDEKSSSQKRLRALQWAVLLIKHLTHLLPRVPDPRRAMEAIVSFGKDVFERNDFDEILIRVRKSEAIHDLSRVLGTSPFLWEEFLRFQNEAIFKILGDHKILSERRTKEAMSGELVRLLAEARGFDGKTEALNEFKDREMFRIDLRHVLRRTSFLEEFAEELSDLAEAVLEAGFKLARTETLQTLPPPMRSANEPSEVCVCGLGKLGGRELGFASDVELLFIYSDDPDSTSRRSQENLRFYSETIQKFLGLIHARSEGVFEVDLRLRPFGKQGALASPLEAFKKYFSPAGEAWNFERQALVKLRPFFGPEWFREEVVRLRDQFVYGDKPFDFKEAAELRARQRVELASPGTVNAKYSHGGLLDVEYLVQTLQIVTGRSNDADIRHPNTLKVLAALRRSGVLDERTYSELREAYVFLRALINALRIVRGNAKDLALPPWNSKEAAALARRMIYDPADFSGDDASVNDLFHGLCVKHMKTAGDLYSRFMQSLSVSETNISASVVHAEENLALPIERVLAPDIDPKTYKRLEQFGFSDISEAAARLRRLAKNKIAAQVLDTAGNRRVPLWLQAGDPNLALGYLEKLADGFSDPEALWCELFESKEKLERLLKVFGSSCYLSELVLNDPERLCWLDDSGEAALDACREALERERETNASALESLRSFRHRETLRIALTEFLFGAPLREVFEVFSGLADFILNRVSSSFFGASVCILGLGKLGGRELNFSSDVDLLFLTRRGCDHGSLAETVRSFSSYLAQGSAAELLYRVDLRLRPHGNMGPVVASEDDAIQYYRDAAEPWEHQVFIKARPVAGNLEIGSAFLKNIKPLVYPNILEETTVNRLREIKRLYEAETERRGECETNVKMGFGGIRDIEFTAQMLELLHGASLPELQEPNTFEALKRLEKNKLLSGSEHETLRRGYEFLRRIENRLQLYQNRQVFNIPKDVKQLLWLARCMNFYGPDPEQSRNRFLAEFRRVKEDCRAIFERIFFG